MYSFKISVNGTLRDVTPYINDIDKVIDIDRSKVTTNLTGNFTFCGVDYDFIKAQSITSEFIFYTYKSGLIYLTCKFDFSTIKFDYDRYICEVSMKPFNKEDKLNQILTNEVDLKKLDIKKSEFSIYNKIMYQVYLLGDTELINMQYGKAWRQPCEVENKWTDGIIDFNGYFGNSSVDDPNQVGAKLLKHSYQYHATYIDTTLTEMNKAWYCADTRYNGYGINKDNQTSISSLFYSEDLKYIAYKMTFTAGGCTFYIKELNTGFTYAFRTYVSSLVNFYDVVFTKDGVDFQFEQPNVVVERHVMPACTTTKPDYYEDGYEANDQSFATNKYHDFLILTKRYCPAEEDYTDSTNLMKTMTYTVSSQTQFEETKWGKAENGKYFVQPTKFQNYEWIPIGKSTWGKYSIWVRNNEDSTTELDYFSDSTPTQVECYKVEDVVNGICKEYDLGLLWQSSFFNTQNDFFNNETIYPCITQITNIRTPDGIPATVNKIRLGELIQFICDLYNLKYTVTETKILFEHRYNSGLNTIDLTSYIGSRSGKSDVYGQNKVSFNIEGLFKKMEFTMQEASDMLNYSIIESDYDNQKTYKTDLGEFFTDYTYCVDSSNKETGYFFFIANSDLELPLEATTIKGNTVKICNKYAALPYCIANYHPYEMQENITIDLQAITPIGGYRGMIQEIEFTSDLQINENNLIKTDLGVAKCLKISLNLYKSIYKLIIAHVAN